MSKRLAIVLCCFSAIVAEAHKYPGRRQ